MSLANKVAPAILKSLSDKQYSIIQFLYHQKRFPNLRSPETFNEKIQWLKLYYRNPLLTQCSDKFLVRDYVRSVLSEDVLTPLLGVYEHCEDINYDELPDRFVLKATHGSGWNILCHSKSSLDRQGTTQALSNWLQTNFYGIGREWAYKDVKPRIICEEFLSEDGSNPPADYKIFCFHGEPQFIQVDYGRFTAHMRNLYDLNWNRIPCKLKYPNKNDAQSPPIFLHELLATARQLSSPFDFVRVDLYVLGNRIFFGELTFYPGKGVERFFPSDYDYIFGSHLDLSKMRIDKYG